MLNLRRIFVLDPSARGAYTLGALLAFIVVVAFVGALGIYRQLDSVAAVQHTLADSQQKLYEAMRVQFDEETELRSYLASNQEIYLDPYVMEADKFAEAIRGLRHDATVLDLPAFEETLTDIARIHTAWENDVAKKLLYGRKTPQETRKLETTGKALMDNLRSDSSRVSELLDARFSQAQSDLKRRINETLGSALGAIVLFGGIGIVSLGLRDRLLRRIEHERRIIETLQRAFSLDWDALPRSRIGTAYTTASRDTLVGGDLYDVRRLDADRGLLMVADVSGKGVEAAVNTAFVKYSIRTLALSYSDPAQLLLAFNGLFLDTIKDPGLFVVVFVGILDVTTLRFSYASAGHSGAYLRRGGKVEQLQVTGPIIGLDATVKYETAVLEMQPRDMLLLATDGLTEARDRNGQPLDDEGAMRLLEGAPADPQACADELVRAVKKRSGGRLHDDLALLAVSIDETSTARGAKAADERA